MYLVKDLDKPLITFQGEKITSGEEGKPVSIRQALTNYLGGYQGKGISGDEFIKAYDLGLKVYSAEKNVELDDEQIKFIQKVIAATPIYISMVAGQVLKRLENSKVEDIPKDAVKDNVTEQHSKKQF